MILGLALVGFISIVSGIITWKMKNIFFRFLILAFCSYTSAFLVYWIPAWSYSVGDQYSSREHLFIQSWTVVGFTAGAIAIIVTMIRNKK